MVQISGGSLVESGLASSLARPGGMVTGLTNLAGDLIGKRSELLVHVLPEIQRIGYLLDSNFRTRGSEFVASAKSAAAQSRDNSLLPRPGERRSWKRLLPSFAKARHRGS